MLLPHGAVIVLADGKAWEIYRNAGNEAAPELTALPVPHLVEQNHGSGTRHGSSSGNPSGHQLDEDAHAAAVAAWLNAKVASRQIEHAVVIAAPFAQSCLEHKFEQTTQMTIGFEYCRADGMMQGIGHDDVDDVQRFGSQHVLVVRIDLHVGISRLRRCT